MRLSQLLCWKTFLGASNLEGDVGCLLFLEVATEADLAAGLVANFFGDSLILKDRPTCHCVVL